MVSFSCDNCQNVFTKPKVGRHFQTCGTRTVSCIDCSVVFNAQSVRAHTSCVTEEEKYGPKSDNACTQAFCGICKLKLNGAVHALQHYESKKHRAAERRQKATAKPPAKANLSEPMAKGTVAEGERAPLESGPPKTNSSNNTNKNTTYAELSSEKNTRPKRLRSLMKKILKSAPKQRLKRDGLIKAVAEGLGKDSPDNLGELIDKKVGKSKAFKVGKSRISLVSTQS